MLYVKEIIVIVIVISLIITPINAVYSEKPIPEWVKNIFEWHRDHQITDKEFVNGIKYLIDNEIVSVSKSDQNMINLLIDENASVLSKNIRFGIPAPLPSNEITNFAVVGYLETLENSIQTLKSIDLTNPELILFAGDQIHVPAETWFDTSDFVGKDKIMPAFGKYNINETAKYIEHYGIESEFYSFDYENVHFVALSIHKFTDDSQLLAQSKFIEDDLKLASNDPNIDWIIVFFYYTMYYDDEISVYEINFRNTLQPLFDLYDVDLVLQGHSHQYERTKPLKFNNTITDDSTLSYVNPDGQIYVTVGTGGVIDNRMIGKSEWVISQNDKDVGFLNIKLTDNGSKIVGEFITNRGAILDNFEICLPSMKMNCADPHDLILTDTNLSRYIDVDNDLAFANLSGANLTGINLVKANLTYANLSGSDLSGMNLTGAKLIEADLSGANLNGTILVGVNLIDANLSGVDLSGKDLSGANLLGLDLSGKDLTGTILYGVNLSESNLSGVDLSGSDLTDTSLILADLTNANLTGAIMGGDFHWGTYEFTSIPDVGIIELEGTLLFETNLSNADLSGINLSGMRMMFTNFSGVDLSGKDLTDTNLILSDLTNANLNGTDLTGADLRRAKFIGTNLQNAVGGPFIGCTGHPLCTVN